MSDFYTYLLHPAAWAGTEVRSSSHVPLCSAVAKHRGEIVSSLISEHLYFVANRPWDLMSVAIASLRITCFRSRVQEMRVATCGRCDRPSAPTDIRHSRCRTSLFKPQKPFCIFSCSLIIHLHLNRISCARLSPLKRLWCKAVFHRVFSAIKIFLYWSRLVVFHIFLLYQF